MGDTKNRRRRGYIKHLLLCLIEFEKERKLIKNMKKKFILPSPEEAKQLRILTGLKTQDLKDKCPVDIGHVYRLEKGQPDRDWET